LAATVLATINAMISDVMSYRKTIEKKFEEDSFVRSKLEYASITWFPHHAVHIAKLHPARDWEILNCRHVTQHYKMYYLEYIN
jgi:hypothetical protein